jgi:hypothetical protein
MFAHKVIYKIYNPKIKDERANGLLHSGGNYEEKKFVVA